MTAPRLLCLALLAGALAGAPSAQPVVSTLTAPFAGSGDVSLHPTTGDLYVADFGDAFGLDPDDWGLDVKRVTPDGTVSVFAAGFFVATGNDFAPDGETLIQAEIGRGYVFRVDPNGTPTLWAVGFSSPVGVAPTADGGAYVAACGANTIQRIAPNGATSLFAESPEFNCPNGLTIAPDGTLYTVNFNDGKILRIGTDGAVRVLATADGPGNGHVAYAAGRLFVANRNGHQILRVSLDGEIEVLAGTGEPGNEDGPADAATFRFPNGIAVTPDGSTVYVNSKTSDNPDALNPVVIRVIRGIPVAEEPAPTPEQQGLLPAVPNPGWEGTTIRYALSAPAEVELAMYTLLGQRVATLEAAARPAGEHAVAWAGTDGAGGAVAAGTYLCRLQTGGGAVYTRLVTLLR